MNNDAQLNQDGIRCAESANLSLVKFNDNSSKKSFPSKSKLKRTVGDKRKGF